MTIEKAASWSQALLKYAFGATLVLIGLDKVLQTNLIVQWTKYISPLAASVIPLDPNTFVMVLGVAEIVVGIALFTRWTRYAAYVVIAVLALIVINLLNLGLYDIAARDALLALSALVLVWLTEAQAYGRA